jgi:hypothetical protein
MDERILSVDEAQALWAEVVEELGRETSASLGEAGMADAVEAFPIASEGDGVDEDWLGLFQSWLFFDYDGAETTVAERWLAREAVVRSGALVETIAAANDAPLSFYRVEAVREGEGLEAADVLTDDRRFVADADLAESVPVGSMFFGRLVDVQGLTLVDAYGIYRVPGEWAEPMRDALLAELGLEMPLSRPVQRAMGTALVVLYAQVADAYLQSLAAAVAPEQGEG